MIEFTPFEVKVLSSCLAWRITTLNYRIRTTRSGDYKDTLLNELETINSLVAKFQRHILIKPMTDMENKTKE